MRLKKNIDLMLAMITVVMNMLWVVLPGRIPIIGIILALPVVFVLPGYVLTEVLFHKRSLDISHHLTISLALSLSIVILGGFFLNILPVGLRAIPWAMFLGLFTIAFSLWAAILRRSTLMNEIQSTRFHFSIYEYILCGLAIIVAIFSLWYSANGVAQQPHPGFTQLWILPPNRNDNSCAVRIGIRSFESTPVTYRITMTINGASITTWPSIILTPQEEWDQLVSLTPRTAGNMYIETRLYRADKPGIVYRNVHLTFHSLKGSSNGQTQQCSIETQ